MEISKAEMANAANAAAAATQSPIELRGGEILVKALQAENVKYIWGYPGGAVLHIYDAFFKQDTIQHVLVRHEQAAVHAADGYARATGDVGVALVTSGPGLTNAVTGIATAYMDSIPMVIISGQVPTAAIGLDAFQECDTVGITRPIVKHNFLVKDARDMAEVMENLVPEAGVEEMEHGVLGAADIEVHAAGFRTTRHPILISLLADEALGICGIAETQIIPA